MIAEQFGFAMMPLCVKIASQWFNSAEQVFYRGMLGMLFMWLLARGQSPYEVETLVRLALARGWVDGADNAMVQPFVYLPLSSGHAGLLRVIVRTGGDPRAAAEQVREAVLPFTPERVAELLHSYLQRVREDFYASLPPAASAMD